MGAADQWGSGAEGRLQVLRDASPSAPASNQGKRKIPAKKRDTKKPQMDMKKMQKKAPAILISCFGVWVKQKCQKSHPFRIFGILKLTHKFQNDKKLTTILISIKTCPVGIFQLKSFAAEVEKSPPPKKTCKALKKPTTFALSRGGDRNHNKICSPRAVGINPQTSSPGLGSTCRHYFLRRLINLIKRKKNPLEYFLLGQIS